MKLVSCSKYLALWLLMTWALFHWLFSIAIQTQWKFSFTLISILIQWLRSDGQQWNYGKVKFPSNLNCRQKNSSESGPWCFSTRATAATVLISQPCISSHSWVKLIANMNLDTAYFWLYFPYFFNIYLCSLYFLVHWQWVLIRCTICLNCPSGIG